MKLKAARLAANMTQKQLAKVVGIAEQMYQVYEYNQKTPNVRTAIRIARALNTTVEELWKLKA